MSSSKKKTKITTEKPSTIPSLPYDLLVSCFARVSRLYFPTLSLVSKSFRSLLVSPELYKTRSSLGHTEICLYVCLQLRPNAKPRWFTLCRKPDHPRTNHTIIKKSSGSGYVLAPVPALHSPQANLEGVVAVGSSIYAIGRPIKRSSSSSFWILDCQSHTWREAPNMLVERKNPTANVFDGKIYVAGGFKDLNSSNWMEVFDTKTQAWEHVLSPGPEICGCHINKRVVIEGELYMFEKKNSVSYKPKENKWEAMEHHFRLGWVGNSYCLIDNVLYCYNSLKGLQWYDTKARYWVDLKSLKRLPKFSFYGFVRLIDYGGKMIVLWEKCLISSAYRKNAIWCAMITLERRNNKETLEIWGEVEWLDAVLTVPNTCGFVCAVVATV